MSEFKVMSLFKFCDGTDVYKKYAKKYKQHDIGYVILGPPGIGKTTYIQKDEKAVWARGEKKDWIDQDDLFNELGVNWSQNVDNQEDFRLNYLRADYISEQSKKLGFRLIGSLFWEYKADAIVIPEWNQHKQFIEKRGDLDKKMVLEVRKLLEEQSKKLNIPVFTTIEAAVAYLNKI